MRATALLLVVAMGAEATAQGSPDFLAAAIDTSVSPRQDFFRFATGGWLRQNPIPSDQSRWGTWNVVSDDLYAKLRRASELAARSQAKRGSAQQLIGDFWLTGMDSTTINAQGLAPLQPELRRIDSIRSVDDVIDIVALLHRRNFLIDGNLGFVGSRAMFAMHVEQDENNGSRRVLSLAQGGLSLGAQAYTAATPQAVRVRAAFREYLFKVFRRLGRDSVNATAKTDAVFDLEAQLALGVVGSEPARVIGRAELTNIAPSIDWNRYLDLIGAPALDSVNLQKPQFYRSLDALLLRTPLETWRDYLRFCLVRSHAPFLDDSTFGEFFSFDSVFTGAARPRPRWKRVVWQEKNWLGEPLAELVSREYFPPTLKARDQSIGESIRRAFRQRLERADWISDGTKRRALRKLERLKIGVGLPDHWYDKSAMDLQQDSYVQNMIRSAEWFHVQEMKLLTVPARPGELDLRYNLGGDAYYDHSNNRVDVPSPIRVPGVRDEDLDEALLYGLTTIGHEIAHAFDSNGRFYDEAGNKVDWWSPTDTMAFHERAQVLIDEFDGFMPIEGRRIDGRRSLAENMADVVGLRIALDAFKETAEYRQNRRRGGFTPLQRFFLGYAYSHACQERPAYLTAMVGGAYAPCRERVNGVVVHLPEFYEAFGVRPGDGMYRAANLRARIW